MGNVVLYDSPQKSLVDFILSFYRVNLCQIDIVTDPHLAFKIHDYTHKLKTIILGLALENTVSNPETKYWNFRQLEWEEEWKGAQNYIR